MLSQDSTEMSPATDTHRRSKSILKNKSDSSKGSVDPESERLLSDTASGALSENGSVCILLFQYPFILITFLYSKCDILG